jgi:thymidine phosphorylase
MAVFLNGLTASELHTWTEAMIDTGDRTDLSAISRPTVDKHSTGGVGDKVSLILVPLMVACGGSVPQLGGRGLGHTGGTIDKLQSHPGFDPFMSPERLIELCNTVGCVVAAAGSRIAPADAKLYQLRDITGTVASIPLIASSIMSKKIAGGVQNLVLDVKVGAGAFMTTIDEATELAETMVQIGKDAGLNTSALLTQMDVPLGRKVGNTLEVDESIEVLKGGGPQDLIDVIVGLAEEMCQLAGLDANPSELLASGAALPIYNDMLRAQGADPDAPLPRAAHTHDVLAPAEGWLTHMNALTIGIASMRLGAGRARKEDTIDYGAGIECLAKPGEQVAASDPVFRLHSNDPATFELASTLCLEAIEVSTTEPPPLPLILSHIV